MAFLFLSLSDPLCHQQPNMLPASVNRNKCQCRYVAAGWLVGGVNKLNLSSCLAIHTISNKILQCKILAAQKLFAPT